MTQLAAPSPHDPLSQLADIHLPEAVSSFPWAPGWWLLLVGTLALITGLGLWLFKRHQQRAWLRQAIRELDQLASSTHLNDADIAQQLNQLLRRVAITHQPKTAGLSGGRWVDFLADSMAKQPNAHQQFTEMLNASYADDAQLSDKTQLCQLCRQWIIAQRGTQHLAGAGR